LVRPVADVARSLSIAEGTLWNWVKAERDAEPDSLSESERASKRLGTAPPHLLHNVGSATRGHPRTPSVAAKHQQQRPLGNRPERTAQNDV
jgi:hypothetical protein